MMPLTTLGDTDIFLTRLDPFTWKEIWTVRLGGSISDSVAMARVSRADGTLLLLARTNSPEFTSSNQEMMLLSYDIEPGNTQCPKLSTIKLLINYKVNNLGVETISKGTLTNIQTSTNLSINLTNLNYNLLNSTVGFK
jgi:hypothetical protein